MELDPETVLRKLGAGRYGHNAVAFSNDDVARYWIKRDGLGNLRKLAEVKPLTYLYGFTRSRVKPACWKRSTARWTACAATAAWPGWPRRPASGWPLAAECGKDESKRLSFRHSLAAAGGATRSAEQA
ncbi:Uncharacterised protein [Chromobacterium violaceum]|uniref:Uncharacterized protein n=1 Tax=Chromobacterium violaceum TaxID=536 RepID=A0A3S4LJQ9_CHRVL|nr:Uncharacterised protein [Chromobacterium violaceum]